MVFCKIGVLSLVTDSKFTHVQKYISNISAADVFTTNPPQIHLYCRVGKIPPSRLHPVQVVALAILGNCISFFLACLAFFLHLWLFCILFNPVILPSGVSQCPLKLFLSKTFQGLSCGCATCGNSEYAAHICALCAYMQI